MSGRIKTARPSGDPAAERRTRLPERNLDVLRAVAVLLVFADHIISAVGHGSDGWNWNWAIGRLGVLFFFVHTSLVLMSSIERGGTSQGWVRRFYIRRAFRIYPLAVFVILLAAVFQLPTHVTASGADMARSFPSWKTLVSNLLLVQNLTGARDLQGVLWSLPLEVQMYVLLPFCYVMARRKSREMAMVVFAFFACAIAMQTSLVGRVPGLWRLSVLTFGPCFISGVLAYHLLRRGADAKAPAWVWPVVLLAVATLFALVRPRAERPDLGWWPCLLLGFAIPSVREMNVSWITTAAHAIAKYSYGIYLVHVPLLWIWLRAIPALPTPARWLGVAVSIVVVPVLLYRFIEEPLLRYGSALAHRLAHGRERDGIATATVPAP
jgi:peptidoglycan/LPS O-acetylase OafA/YrhL